MASADRSVLLTSLALTSLLATGCATHGGATQGISPPPEFVVELTSIACPNFVVQPRTITIQDGDVVVDLGNGHSIEFRDGAVPPGSSYQVRAGRPQRAEIQIDPVGGAPRDFAADVFLVLSYAACPQAQHQDLVMVKRDSPTKSLGGRPDPQAQTLRALIPHLTAFAIAR